MEKHKLDSISLTVRDRGILLKFSTPKVSRVYWQLFTKIAFPPLLAAILNFCVKCKSAFISETVQDGAILTKFLICRVYMQSLLATFCKNRFPATFSNHFEFLCKMQKCIYLANGSRYSDFDEILDSQGICRVYWRHFARITFPPFFGGHLEFFEIE